MARPESAKPESAKPESAKSESGKSESAKSESAKPESAKSDTGMLAAERTGGAVEPPPSTEESSPEESSDSATDETIPPARSEAPAQETTPPPSDPIQPEVITPDDVVGTQVTNSEVTVETARALWPPAGRAAVTPVSPPRPSVVGLVSGVVFNGIAALERLVTGPPVLPPNSTVAVSSSTLEIESGHVVPADWYFPAGDEPPTRLIVLQHGFLAIGPMYSYTAANLAERTNSIVVTPTLTSNPFADGSLWLGGAGMHQAVADLFVGDREALTASAVAAGYAQRYSLDRTEAALPQQFGLVGHSLGGALVSGVAGYLADNGAADDLVGVILLDGVPTGDQLPRALMKLEDYEAETGRFVPVREIGAPINLWNFLSNANESLSAARPERYVGVVLDGGAHMDSMQGGNPLIQFAAYLAAGFPQKQNPTAVQELTVTWLDEWFDDRTDVGDDLVPGSTIAIPTPEGPARGVVIGNPPAVASSSSRTLREAA